jgi:hypothetical protein
MAADRGLRGGLESGLASLPGRPSLRGTKGGSACKAGDMEGYRWYGNQNLHRRSNPAPWMPRDWIASPPVEVFTTVSSPSFHAEGCTATSETAPGLAMTVYTDASSERNGRSLARLCRSQTSARGRQRLSHPAFDKVWAFISRGSCARD